MRLNVRDVSRLLRVSENTIYRWIEQKNLPAFKINGQYRFNRAHLLEWATVNRMNAPPGLLHEPEQDGINPLLHEALHRGGVFYKVMGDRKASILGNIVDKMPLPEEVDRSFLLQMLITRETLASTAIGGGIAIPHMRGPLVMNLPGPMICLSFLAHPVDYNALDGKPVHTMFTIVSPTIKAHLGLLSKLSFGLGDPVFSAVIARKAPISEILAQAEALELRMAATSGLSNPHRN